MAAMNDVSASIDKPKTRYEILLLPYIFLLYVLFKYIVLYSHKCSCLKVNPLHCTLLKNVFF